MHKCSVEDAAIHAACVQALSAKFCVLRPFSKLFDGFSFICFKLAVSIVGVVFLLSETSAVAAIPFPRSTAGPPPDYYLDIPFLPQDTGPNRVFQLMNEEGVRPFVKYWGDFLADVVGGRDQTADWGQLLLVGVKLDFEKIMRWPGGGFTASAADRRGRDLSGSVGSIFNPSQAVVLPGFTIYLLHITQLLADEKVELKAGRISAGALFASLPAMGLTVNGAVNGNPASLFYNTVGFRSTSKASWAAAIKVKPISDTYVQTGIFQVDPRVNNASFHGIDFSFRKGDGVFVMGELGWSPTYCKEKTLVRDTKEACTGLSNPPYAGLPGLYQMGAYYQNYPMPMFSGNGTINNAYGFYLQGQQMLWRSRTNADHNFTIWNGITYSPQAEIAILPVMAYGGLGWSGLIPTRDKDQLLLNYYIGGFSGNYSQKRIGLGLGPSTIETVFELSYIMQVTRQIQFQPDLQWFIHPGGSSRIPNALVVGFQISFVF